MGNIRISFQVVTNFDRYISRSVCRKFRETFEKKNTPFHVLLPPSWPARPRRPPTRDRDRTRECQGLTGRLTAGRSGTALASALTHVRILEGFMVEYGRRNRALAPIPHDKTSIRRIRTAQDHAQSLMGFRDLSTRTSKYHAPLHAQPIARASRPRSSPRPPRPTSHTRACEARVRRLDDARLEVERANRPVARLSSARSAARASVASGFRAHSAHR